MEKLVQSSNILAPAMFFGKKGNVLYRINNILIETPTVYRLELFMPYDLFPAIKYYNATLEIENITIRQGNDFVLFKPTLIAEPTISKDIFWIQAECSLDNAPVIKNLIEKENELTKKIMKEVQEYIVKYENDENIEPLEILEISRRYQFKVKQKYMEEHSVFNINGCREILPKHESIETVISCLEKMVR